MNEYSELNCPGCAVAMFVHNQMPDWFEQLCPFCIKKFTVKRWRVTANRVAKQAAEAKKAEKPGGSTDLAGA